MLKKINLTITLLILGVLLNYSSAQTTNGSWKIYTSFKEVKDISVNGPKVWAATMGGLFTFDYNVSANTLVKYTTMEGLLSNELTSVLIDNSGGIWTGSLDGAITLLNPSTGILKTNSDIQTSSEPSKGINNIFQYGDFAFISTDFSIVKMKISSFELVDQPYTHLGNLIVPNPVYQTVVKNDTIWAATKNGIAYANINNYLPIQSNWGTFTTANSVLSTNWINCAAYFNNRVYFGTDSGMVYHENGTLHLYAPLYNGNPLKESVKRLTVTNGSMYIVSYKTSNNIYKVDAGNTGTAQLILQGQEINTLKVNQEGDLLLATQTKGVNHYKNGSNNFIQPSGPNSNLFVSIAVDNLQNVWGSSGGDQNGIFMYNGTNWKTYTTENYPIMRGNDFRQMYASRFSNDVWAGGYGEGLLKIMGDSVYLFYDENSCLRPFQNAGFVLVEGMYEDDNANLWVLNRAAPEPILNFTTCTSYPTPENAAATTLIFLTIDNYQTKWITFPNFDLKGITYFNENVPSGKIILGGSIGSDVQVANHIAVDKNGEIWIATDNGIGIVRDPYQVVANPNSVPFIEKMRIIENGISTPLTENVLAIAVDALNNKWIGTNSSGVLYLSSDGSTILNRFDTRNSPLLDDKISTIAIDPKSGIVYFGTQKGMISYQTIAVEAVEDCNEIKAGPNPYVIPASSLLRIDGLVEGSSIKILTVSGTLVAEFESPGGRIANWDGKDLNGNYVSSGIYIIVGFNEDGSKVCTGKVAVVRK